MVQWSRAAFRGGELNNNFRRGARGRGLRRNSCLAHGILNWVPLGFAILRSNWAVVACLRILWLLIVPLYKIPSRWACEREIYRLIFIEQF